MDILPLDARHSPIVVDAQAIREPFDYYKMGCDFAEGMVDLKSSVIEGAEHIETMRKQVGKGNGRGGCVQVGGSGGQGGGLGGGGGLSAEQVRGGRGAGGDGRGGASAGVNVQKGGS
jgi:hypothetical protein